MRIAFIPWIAFAVVVVGSGEVARPSEPVEPRTERERPRRYGTNSLLAPRNIRF